MRIWICAIAVALLVALVGCSASGGGTVGTDGVYNGTIFPSGGGTNASFDADIVVTGGTTVSGFARIVQSGNVYTSPITGTLNGTQLTFSGNFGAFGSSITFTGNSAFGVITGSYGGSASGLFSITRSNVQRRTLPASSSWTGTFNAGGGVAGTITAATINTSGNNQITAGTATLTITSGGSGSASVVITSGEIFGSTVTMRGVASGAYSGAITFVGQISDTAPPGSVNDRIAGTISGALTGSFSITKT